MLWRHRGEKVGGEEIVVVENVASNGDAVFAAAMMSFR